MLHQMHSGISRWCQFLMHRSFSRECFASIKEISLLKLLQSNMQIAFDHLHHLLLDAKEFKTLWNTFCRTFSHNFLYAVLWKQVLESSADTRKVVNDRRCFSCWSCIESEMGFLVMVSSAHHRFGRTVEKESPSWAGSLRRKLNKK